MSPSNTTSQRDSLQQRATGGLWRGSAKSFPQAKPCLEVVSGREPRARPSNGWCCSELATFALSPAWLCEEIEPGLAAGCSGVALLRRATDKTLPRGSLQQKPRTVSGIGQCCSEKATFRLYPHWLCRKLEPRLVAVSGREPRTSTSLRCSCSEVSSGDLAVKE